MVELAAVLEVVKLAAVLEVVKVVELAAEVAEVEMVELAVVVEVVQAVKLVEFTVVELVDEVAKCHFQILEEAMRLGMTKSSSKSTNVIDLFTLKFICNSAFNSEQALREEGTNPCPVLLLGILTSARSAT